jgi:hypothetical protein
LPAHDLFRIICAHTPFGDSIDAYRKGISMNRYCFALLAFGLATSQLAAAPTRFFQKNVFLSETGATSATGELPNLGRIQENVRQVGDITFSTSSPSSLFIGGIGAGGPPGGDWTTRLPGSDIALSDVENLDIVSDHPIKAMGFDFVKPGHDDDYSPGDPSVAHFQVTVKLGNVQLHSFEFSAPSPQIPSDTASFVGIVSDQEFDRLEVRDLVAAPAGIDDEYFGQVYTSTSSAIPLPNAFCASLPIFLAMYTWRRRLTSYRAISH